MEPRDFALGFVGSNLTHAASYPFEHAKIIQQQSQNPISARNVFARILSQGGFKNLYLGFPAAQAQRILRNLWVLPATKAIPTYLCKRHPDLNPDLAYAIGGAITGSFNATISTPLSNLLTHSIRCKKPIRSSFNSYRSLGLMHLFDQFPKMLFLQGSGWTIFGASQNFYRRSYKDLTHKESLHLGDLSLITIATLSTTLLFSAPIDYTFNRSHLAVREGQVSRLKESLTRVTLINAYRRGGPLYFASNFLTSLFAIYFFEYAGERNIEYTPGI